MTDATWKDELERDGVVHIPQALDPGDIEKLANLSLQSIDDYFDSDDLLRTEDGVPLKLLYPLSKYHDFISVLGRKEIREIVDSLYLKKDSVLTWEDVLIKIPYEGPAVVVHQDVGLTAGAGQAYSLGISLHGDRENPVFFLPGSHRFGPLTAIAINTIRKECIKQFRPIITQPGDIVVHDAHVMHYSESNLSNNPRITWYMEFRSMRSLIEEGPWTSDWVHRRRAIWVYARVASGENTDKDEPEAVKKHLVRLRSDQSAFRVPHTSETIRYDETSPYNHFVIWTGDWKTSRPAPDRTHHLRIDDGHALYHARYDDVLPFHAPGLAPVRLGSESFHILPNGNPAYMERYDRTFGFYENLAAVSDNGDWFHIHPDGRKAYKEAYIWCGNFQGGRCAVRGLDGSYLHVTPEGEPAYDTRWRYAGDFRDGAAVVQSGDGRSTHIDPWGEPVHGGRFLDLDVFHKGCARARDDDGWMHIDMTGRPLYARRFAAVEPFYNGQARVERFDGGLEVIDEAGCRVVELRPPLKSEFAALSDDMTGFWRTQAICAAVELGIFEALPATAGGVARTRGLDPARTRRLLRALAELRLAVEADGEWRATVRGGYLRTGHPRTLVDAAQEYGRAFPRLWKTLPEAVRGAGWTPPDVFGDVAADPDRTATHHRMLASYALHDYPAAPAALDLRGDEHVIDAGGGLGALARLLTDEHPALRVTVLDRPEVVEQATRRGLGGRIRLRSADLFEPWGIEGDAVVMARVLHDWDDAPALRLLHRARRALPSGGRLFVVEMVMPENGVAGSLCDLHLLMATGGRERTAAEYAALLGEAGFGFDGVRRIPALPSIVVGVAR